MAVVLMAPDVPDETLDDRVVGAVDAHVQEVPFELKVIRYPHRQLEVTELPEQSRRVVGEFAATSVIWIDLDPPEHFTIYLYDPRSERLLQRKVPRSSSSNAAAVETLANITGSIVAEAVHGPVAGMTDVDARAPPEPEPPEPPSPQVRSEPDRWNRLWLGLGYAGTTFADALPWQHGISVSAAVMPVRLGRAGLLHIGVRYDVVIATPVSLRGIELELRRHPARASVGYRHQFASAKADVELLVHGVVDPIVRRSRDRDPSDETTPPSGSGMRMFSSAGVSVGAGWVPVPWVRLFAAVGGEVVTSRADYVILTPERTLIVAPHPARFTLDAGVQFGLFRRPKANSRRRGRGAKND